MSQSQHGQPACVSPIQSAEQIDLAGKRQDGGVDLFIAPVGPLDGSPETQRLLLDKLASYLAQRNTEEFQDEFQRPPPDKVRILVACERDPDPAIVALLGRCVSWVEANNARLELHVRGAARPLAAPRVEDTIREPTDADRERLSAREAAIGSLVQARYGATGWTRDESDLQMLQRLLNESAVGPGQDEELSAMGVVFGQVLAARTPLQWITVEFAGERHLALQYPRTTVILFPGGMIAKRVQSGEGVDVAALFESVVAQVEQMKDRAEYQRQGSENN